MGGGDPTRSLEVNRFGFSAVPVKFHPKHASEVAGFAATATPFAGLELRTRRLVLRPLELDDYDETRRVLEANTAWLATTDMMPLGGPPSSVDAFAERLAETAFLRSLDQLYEFGVFLDAEIVGMFSLEAIVRGRAQSATATAWIAEVHAGQSFMHEASAALCQFGFGDLGLHRIEAAVLTDNTTSQHALADFGLRDEGVSIRCIQVGGVWRDHHRYAITAEEWSDRRAELRDAWGLTD